MNGSSFQIKTSGGPLFIQLSVAINGNGAQASCAPYLNDQWAGTWGGLVSPSGMGREGGMDTTIGWVRFALGRVYPNIPAGTYTVDVRCATDSNTLTVSGTFASNVNVVELK